MNRILRVWLATAVTAGALVRFADAAPIGGVIATFTPRLEYTLADPHHNFVYGLINTSTVEAINTTTLSIAGTLNLPAIPADLVLSPDGQTLYAVDQTNDAIEAINTATMTITQSFPVPSRPDDVAVGSGNQLYVLDAGTTYDQLQEINLGTKAVATLSVPGSSIFLPGLLRMSPDQRTLYYLAVGYSPSEMAAINVSTGSPSILHSNAPVTNGGYLGMNSNGTLLAPVGGGGPSPSGSGPSYSIPVFQSSNFSLLGYLDTNAYPGDVVFSPDGRFAYTSSWGTYDSSIDVFSATNFQYLGGLTESSPFALPAVGTLALDDTGTELFVSYNSIFSGNVNETLVYAVPEPDSRVLLCGAVLVLAAFRLWRRRCRVCQ